MAAVSRPRRVDVNLRSGPQMREYVAIADRIARELPGRVLDWGCGHGQMTSLLRRRGLEVEAFDYLAGSEPKLLPLGDDEFDTVLSCGVLEHVQRPGDSLDELHRVLRPGGRLLIYKLPNRTSCREGTAPRAGMYYPGAYPDDRVYDRRSATALLNAHRFRVDDFRRTNML